MVRLPNQCNIKKKRINNVRKKKQKKKKNRGKVHQIDGIYTGTYMTLENGRKISRRHRVRKTEHQERVKQTHTHARAHGQIERKKERKKEN